MIVHQSDCAKHNRPAYPPGPCDCGAQKTWDKIVQKIQQDISAGLAWGIKDIRIHIGNRDWQFDLDGELIGCGSRLGVDNER